MINTAEIHRLIKLRLNKLDSNSYQDFLPPDIDDIINQATLKLISFYDTNTDRSQLVKDIIAPFKVSYPDQPELEPVTTTQIGNYYTFDYDLDNLKYKYYRFLRAWITCGDFVAPVSIITSDEQHKLNNTYIRSDSKWGRYVGMFIKTYDKDTPSLRLYSDKSENYKLRIEYIRYPNKVFLGNYNSLEYIECMRRNEQYGSSESCNQYYSVTTPPQDSELGLGALDLLIDMCVYMLSGITENQLILQISNAEISKIQNRV